MTESLEEKDMSGTKMRVDKQDHDSIQCWRSCMTWTSVALLTDSRYLPFGYDA
jgi:hypothetical protein